MKNATRLLLILLTNILDSKTMFRLNQALVELLYELAEKTETDIDDKIVALVERFIQKPQ